MFLHNFKYSLKALLRDRTLIFWTFAFPIILGTLFYLAFSNLTSSEKLSLIKIAVVDTSEFRENPIYQPAITALSNPESENQLFETTYTSESEARELLENDEIDGYIEIQNHEPQLTIKTNGVNQTIIKYTLEEIASLRPPSSITLSAEIPSGKLDYVMVEYYTLIAMTCLYGGIIGMIAINQRLANMSNAGKRVAVAPTRKSVIVLSSALASYVVQLSGLALLFAYTVLVLKVDYGEHTGLIVLLSLVGSLAGLVFGIFIATVFKASENTKTGIMISFTMFGCFLAGMMGVSIKYYFDQHTPLLNLIDPANMITDGFYSLYYYESLERFWFNLASLGVFSTILTTFAIITLRRQTYDYL